MSPHAILALRSVRDCGVILARTPAAADRFDRLCRERMLTHVDRVAGREYRITLMGEAHLMRAGRFA